MWQVQRRCSKVGEVVANCGEVVGVFKIMARPKSEGRGRGTLKMGVARRKGFGTVLESGKRVWHPVKY